MIMLSASKHELKIFSLSSSSPANVEAMQPILYKLLNTYFVKFVSNVKKIFAG